MVFEDGETIWGAGGPKPAAEGFKMEARQRSIYDWVRQIRGGVLAGAFTVERNLSAAIIYFMLGDRVKRDDVQDAFDEGLLSPLAFERRIKVAVLVAHHFMPEDEAKTFRLDLDALRITRNALAHKPFWFHPQLNDKGEVFDFVPMIERSKVATPMTTPFANKLNADILGLIERSAKLAAAVAGREISRAK